MDVLNESTKTAWRKTLLVLFVIAPYGPGVKSKWQTVFFP